jgi:tRNA U54 and U55 pseudouridine synthase Pus10
MKIDEKIIEVLKDGYICDPCLGRCVAQLLSGLTNEQRGHIVRHFLAFLLDSGEKLDVDFSNFYGIKFRNIKLEVEKPKECKVCKNFFYKEIDALVKRAIEKLKKIDFEGMDENGDVGEEG